MGRIKIYLAGPYTKPSPELNTRAAMVAAEQLLLAGYCPFIPHLSHYWNAIYPKSYKTWIDYDLEWLPCCAAVLRIPGESPGADQECEIAIKLGIPVFYSIEELTKQINSATIKEKPSRISARRAKVYEPEF